MNKALTLYELNGLVRETLETCMTDEYWVEAELSSVRESYGHCYLELIQKDENNNTPVARANARIWKNTWMLIRPYFERVTGQSLNVGMKVLLKVVPQFHENYGFSWIVNDIDPAYTLGDMAKRRQESIARLKEEGVYELNKDLEIPMFPQHIAVISSPTAAGYGDFCNQLQNNGYGYYFNAKLFPSVMQGEQVEQSIINALDAIYDEIDSFDVVVIIRGGGATSDLSGFDTYPLALNVAQFPLPVITGIGHERDDTILDMISNRRVKTPTAAAELLISILNDVEVRIDDAKERIVKMVKQKMETEKIRLNGYSNRIPALFSVVRTRQESSIEMLFQRLLSSMQRKIDNHRHYLLMTEQNIQPLSERKLINERHRLQLLLQRVDAVNPQRMLQRGYSITMINGKSVRDPKLLKKGDEIETKLEKGNVKSIVK